MAIYKDGKTYTVRFHTSGGKTIVKRGFHTKSEARHFENEIRKSKDNIPERKTFEEVFNEMNSRYLLREDRSTHNETTSVYKNHIAEVFPVKKIISKISSDDIEEFRVKLAETGASNFTINKTTEVVKRTFNYGIKKKYTYINPAAYCEKLKHTKKPIDFLNYKEFCTLMSVVENPRDRAMYYVFFYNGLRIGELRGIKWRDVDFFNLTIHINKHIVEPGNRSFKPVPGRKNTGDYFSEIDPETADQLKKWLEIAKKIDGWNVDFYVFGDISPFGRTTISSWIKRDVEAAGIKKHIHPHCFRHSCVSFLWNYSDLNEQDIADRINDSVEVVKKTYAHIFKSKKGKYAKAIRDAIDKAKNTELFSDDEE
ncbi:MAG: site-specific integrase [Solobacterium sp.]|nr:site-specific integrase [Solobacterium sp.]